MAGIWRGFGLNIRLRFQNRLTDETLFAQNRLTGETFFIQNRLMSETFSPKIA